jgi:hypothetical protein
LRCSRGPPSAVPSGPNPLARAKTRSTVRRALELHLAPLPPSILRLSIAFCSLRFGVQRLDSPCGAPGASPTSPQALNCLTSRSRARQRQPIRGDPHSRLQGEHERVHHPARGFRDGRRPSVLAAPLPMPAPPTEAAVSLCDRRTLLAAWSLPLFVDGGRPNGARARRRPAVAPASLASRFRRR